MCVQSSLGYALCEGGQKGGCSEMGFIIIISTRSHAIRRRIKALSCTSPPLLLILSKHSWGLLFGRVGPFFNKKKISLIEVKTAHRPQAARGGWWAGVEGTNNSLGNSLDSFACFPHPKARATTGAEATSGTLALWGFQTLLIQDSFFPAALASIMNSSHPL